MTSQESDQVFDVVVQKNYEKEANLTRNRREQMVLIILVQSKPELRKKFDKFL